MIKLITEYLDEEIRFEEGIINVLELNNKELFNKIVFTLNKHINSKEEISETYLLEDGKMINFQKNSLMIFDFFNIIANQTKVLKVLYENIEKEYKFNYNDEEILKIQKNFLESVRSVLSEYDYEFTQKEIIEVKDILKILDLKFDQSYYDKPLENIYLLIDLITNFSLYKVIILVNIKCYFAEDELIELYKMIIYKKVNVLFIEYYKKDFPIMYERKIIVDEDFDEFYIN